MAKQFNIIDSIEILNKEGYIVSPNKELLEKEKEWFDDLEAYFIKLYQEEQDRLLFNVDRDVQFINTIKDELSRSYRNQMRMLVLFTKQKQKLILELKELTSLKGINTKLNNFIPMLKYEMN